MKRNNNTFYEYQQLKRWFILLVFVPLNAVFITGCIIQIGLGKPWGNNPMPNEGLIILSVLMILFMVNMLYTNLKTAIDKDGIHIRIWLFPFYSKSKSFLWEEISDIAIKKYNPILTYGGWGIRTNFSNLNFSLGKIKYPPKRGINLGINSIAYTMSGNTGIQFVFQNKQRVLIGTNKPEELSETLMQLGKSESNK